MTVSGLVATCIFNPSCTRGVLRLFLRRSAGSFRGLRRSLPLHVRPRRAGDKQDQHRQFFHSLLFGLAVRCDSSVITIFTLPINRPVLVLVSKYIESPAMLKSARWIVVRSCELRT